MYACKENPNEWHFEGRIRDGISVKNSTVEYLSPKIAHKMRISRHIVIRAKTA